MIDPLLVQLLGDIGLSQERAIIFLNTLKHVQVNQHNIDLLHSNIRDGQYDYKPFEFSDALVALVESIEEYL